MMGADYSGMDWDNINISELIKNKNALKKNKKKGKKHDEGKLRHSLIPIGVIEEIIKVLMWGSKIYGDDNWKKVEHAEERYYDATRRHMEKRRGGELRATDSGLLHSAHQAANDIFAIWFDMQKEQNNEKT